LASRLIVNDVHAGYGASVRVLHGVSITVEAGETVVLLGSNGNGKSTLIKCITGIISPASGEIILEHDGERIDLVGKTPEQIVELGISLVPEGRRLFPKLSVEENLMLGAYRSAARRELDLAVHDDVAAVGDFHRLIEILLGHQHGQLAFVFQLFDFGDHAAD
jgi:branched-chain amino acid transport system ATP-binding protein